MKLTKQLGYIKFRMDYRREIKNADRKMLNIMREELTREFQERRKKGE